MQASEDPTVHPDSATEIFRLAGSARKEMIIFHRARHGIINGEGSREVYDRLHSWLNSIMAPERIYVNSAPALPEPPPTPALPEEVQIEPGIISDETSSPSIAPSQHS
jgi:hypothetical protein